MNARIFQSPRLTFIRSYLIGSLLLLSIHANATTELLLQLDSSWRYDSNPLRLTENVDIRTALGTDRKSDSVIATDVRFAIVHPLDSPETQLVFTGQLGNQGYRQLTQLDNTEYAYKGSLEWRSGDLWKGRLLRSQEQQLYDYLNGTLTIREMVHRTTDTAEVALRVTPDLEFPFSIQNQQKRYDTPTNRMFDSRRRSLDGGVQFRNEAGSNISVGLRSAEVNFPERTVAHIASLDSGYGDNEIYLASDWRYSVFTRLSGRIGSLQRTYATLESKNFSTLTTELRVQHDYSPKTRLTIDFWSRPDEVADSTILYAMVSGLRVGTTWLASDKTRVNLQASKELQRYQYVTTIPGQSNPELHRLRIGGSGTYAVSRDIQMYIDGFRDRLDQGTFGANIGQNMLRVGLEYTFENVKGLAQRTALGERR